MVVVFVEFEIGIRDEFFEDLRVFDIDEYWCLFFGEYDVFFSIV